MIELFFALLLPCHVSFSWMPCFTELMGLFHLTHTYIQKRYKFSNKEFHFKTASTRARNANNILYSMIFLRNSWQITFHKHGDRVEYSLGVCIFFFYGIIIFRHYYAQLFNIYSAVKSAKLPYFRKLCNIFQNYCFYVRYVYFA